MIQMGNIPLNLRISNFENWITLSVILRHLEAELKLKLIMGYFHFKKINLKLIVFLNPLKLISGRNPDSIHRCFF
jgi:hypothetical protein